MNHNNEAMSSNEASFITRALEAGVRDQRRRYGRGVCEEVKGEKRPRAAIG